VAIRRRANFRLLLDYLSPWAMAKQLPPDVVPLGFPIRVPDRDALLKRLYAAQIYAPVHWPLGDTVPQEHEASWRLSESLLTVPCDQRIAPDRMAEVGEIVRKELQR
jgi:dTDP-4-amino-4,6-dideoxygalactose transaminase